VHTFPSLQLSGVPPTQRPPEQTSPVVHRLPSSHGLVLFVWVQPVAGSQASVVHGLPSSQLPPAWPTHAPFTQASFTVHALLSSHAAVVFSLCTVMLRQV